MSSLGTAYVQIVPSAQGIGGKISSAIQPGAASAGTAAGKTMAGKMGTALRSGMKQAGAGLMAAGAVASMVSAPIIKGIKDSMEAYKVQSAAENKLTEIYKTRMGVSGKVAQKTMELASSLQKVGVVGDEVQLSGAQQLATFAKYPDTVNSLLPAMNNLLVQQHGLDASAEDATSTANLMGKVLMGQTGALKRVGISFDENSEKIMKNGTEQEKAAELAKVITENVGNMNEKFAQTPEGKIAQMNNTLGDMKEKLGAALAPAIAEIAGFVSEKIVPIVEKFLNFVQSHPIIGKIIIGITALLAVGGPLLMMLGMMLIAFSVLTAPILAVVGIIAGAIVVGILLYKNWDKVKAFLGKIWEGIKTVASTIWEGIKTAITLPITIAVGIIKGTFMAAKTVLTGIWTGLKDAASTIWGGIKSVASTIWGGISKTVGGAVKGVLKTTKSNLNAMKRAYKENGGGIKGVWAAAHTAIKRTNATVFNSINKATGGKLKKMLTTVKDKVKAIKDKMGFSGMADKAKKAFEKLKDGITSKLQAAKDKLKKIVDKIQGLFPLNIGKIFSNLKVPHISVSGGKAPFGIAGKGRLPKFGVTWGAKGGILDGATLIGGGEAGREALLPLDRNTGWMDDLAARLGGNGQVVVNLNYDASDDAVQMVRDVARGLRRYRKAGAF